MNQFLVALFTLLAVSGGVRAAPFCGFYCGGGLGWDFFRVQERREFHGAAPFFAISNGSANGFRGQGVVGWMGNYGRPCFGARVGYQGFVDDRVREMPLFQSGSVDNRADFWKIQGAFFDVTPGLQFGRCFLVSCIFGVGWTQYHYFGREITGRVFRDEKLWAALPRLGAGLQWNFWRCATVGFEWTYNFPGNAIYHGPAQGPSERDGNTRREKVRGNQFAFTLNWYFS